MQHAIQFKIVLLDQSIIDLLRLGSFERIIETE